MTTINLPNNIPLIIKEVPEFPDGIKAAFDELYEKFQGREYYGLSHMGANGNIIYKAAAEEQSAGEAAGSGYREDTILKGDYIAEEIVDWMSRTHLMKEAFDRLMKNERFDDTHDCVEWYQSDDKMLCMVRCK